MTVTADCGFLKYAVFLRDCSPNDPEGHLVTVFKSACKVCASRDATSGTEK